MDSESLDIIIPEQRHLRWSLLSQLMSEWHQSLLPQSGGYAPAELLACEQRLGLTLPVALKEWYTSFGLCADVWNQQDHFLPPQEITIEQRVLIFYVENQAVTSWGIEISDLHHQDPTVVMRDENHRWRPLIPVSLFAIQMFLYTLQFTARALQHAQAQPDCLQRITRLLPQLPLPPFIFPRGEFTFYGNRERIVLIEDTHFTIAARHPAALAEFQVLLAGTKFEILDSHIEPLRIISPDRRYAVQFDLNLGELRMGSPSFGPIRIIDTQPPQKAGFFAQLLQQHSRAPGIDFGERLFGETVLFSPNSNLVALEQLLTEPRLRTQLLVVDLSKWKIFFIDAPPLSTAVPMAWQSNDTLAYLISDVSGRREQRTWKLPVP